jgi:hypothetical protein
MREMSSVGSRKNAERCEMDLVCAWCLAMARVSERAGPIPTSQSSGSRVATVSTALLTDLT